MKLLRGGGGKDIEEVQKENDVLARKVHNQEEEFKLQNETMMRELNEVNIFFSILIMKIFSSLMMMISIDYDNDNKACKEIEQLRAVK